jgi:C4-dicarboxylate transporter, DctQ subunit
VFGRGLINTGHGQQTRNVNALEHVMLNKLQRVVHGLNSVCATIAGLILLFVTISIFIDVWLRYLFGSPSIWITEISSYLFLYIIFLGTAHALVEGLHIRVTFLTSRFNKNTRRFVNIVTHVFCLIFVVVLLWQTAALTWEAYEGNWTTPTILSTPFAYIYVIMIVGSALLIITILFQLMMLIAGQSIHKEEF